MGIHDVLPTLLIQYLNVLLVHLWKDPRPVFTKSGDEYCNQVICSSEWQRRYTVRIILKGWGGLWCTRGWMYGDKYMARIQKYWLPNYRQTSNIRHNLLRNNITYRRCSNYIFILVLTPGFNGLGRSVWLPGTLLSSNWITQWQPWRHPYISSIIVASEYRPTMPSSVLNLHVCGLRSSVINIIHANRYICYLEWFCSF